MKPSTKRILALLGLGAVFFAAAASFGVMVGVTSIHVGDAAECFDKSGREIPLWAARAMGAAILAGIVAAIGVAFLPFRRLQRDLPAWFRAHFFVPALFACWLLAGSAFPFSPHQLTCVLPGFLLGADDRGVGNVYAYTKLADWIALLAGCAACGRLAAGAKLKSGLASRFRACFPHLLAAAALHFIAPLVAGGRVTLIFDDAILFAWLLAGFFAVSFFQSFPGETSRKGRSALAWAAAFAWLFVPVAQFRP